jgi:hypothetical protein
MNLNRKSVLSLVLVGFIATNFSGCASKSGVSPDSSKDECGEGTTAQGSILGAVLGGAASIITGGDKRAIILATAAGAGLGAMAGHLLSEMQCKYKGQERELIKQINVSKENQEKLSKDSGSLSKKITELSNNMKDLNIQKEISKSEKEKLLSTIDSEKKTLIALQRENSSYSGKVIEYGNSVDTYKYKDSDKKSLRENLQEINVEQNKIATACVNNLKKLEELERRITS